MSSSNPLYIYQSGSHLLETPLLNKGSAFTAEERQQFNLEGLLPPRYETIEEQVARAYRQFKSFDEPINQHIYLRAIQDENETLFYRLLQSHLEEMMPIIYTPIVGDACEHFSDIYRSARGLFIAWSQRDRVEEVLRNAIKDSVKVIVITDGERILGLGDQGIGGMGIPIGKLALYTVCGGISPAYTMPIMLDVGTNNEALLNDPMYMGERHPRIGADDYNAFVDIVIRALKKRWPQALIQFEDFAQANATPLLQRYRDTFCCFNDDIQGTAAVSLGTVLAACKAKGVPLAGQKLVIAGAGSAGCGIAAMLLKCMCDEGLKEEQALANIFMVDKDGLLSSAQPNLRDFQTRFARDPESSGGAPVANLEQVVHYARPDILIGVSGQSGLFSQAVVTAMLAHCSRPIILPLSNPSRQVEARPEQVIEWTGGTAIVATGSPFADVSWNGTTYPIAQCNNAYIFPGLGLGVVASSARLVTDEMMMVAARTLAEHSPLAQDRGPELLPRLRDIAGLSQQIAFNVGKVAQEQGLAPVISDDHLQALIYKNFWQPKYRAYKRVSK
ncbi:MAG: NAD-dependent malic enzyme [Gammaproteobacteria bacterium]|uniref:oxaloacetate-decarboxylating malate dehydrogenase n=1 Tax=Pseudomaricurvus alcaniphilus TaxID=1166482 RepID=UPI00140C6EDB|nr:NAD-dependent malic enzyme [Gammaproteobacteria bacterium]NHN39490.1 NAD-dependent malic enzyme [Pseudomaricurvus alcaniphilus]